MKLFFSAHQQYSTINASHDSE